MRLWISKLLFVTTLIVVTAFGGGTGSSQGTFLNLGFESANVPDLPPDQGGFVSAAEGLSGWNVSPPVLIGHNTRSLGGPAVAIEGPLYNPSFILQGKYTAYLWNTASISQTGLVPETARSLYFISAPLISSTEPNFVVTVGDASIPLAHMGDRANYSIWAGDISRFAGLTEELRFTAPPGLGGYLDLITFSPIALPEPSTSALLVVAGLLLWIRSLTRNRRNSAEKGQSNIMS